MTDAIRHTVHEVLEGLQGFVAWDAMPPHGIPLWRHELSFMQAVYLGMCFTQTECRNEWLTISRDLLPLIRTRTRFKERVPPVIDHDLSYIGDIGNIQVFLDLNWPQDLKWSWMCGSNLRVCAGQILNSPHVVQPPPVEPPHF